MERSKEVSWDRRAGVSQNGWPPRPGVGAAHSFQSPFNDSVSHLNKLKLEAQNAKRCEN